MTTTLDQTRTPGLTNEISTLTNTTGEAWATPQYDAAGNETVTPSPLNPTDALNVQVDAWNHVTHVWDAGSIDVSYQYDGLGNMIVRVNNMAPSGQVSTTDIYYSGQQVLEERDRLPSAPAVLVQRPITTDARDAETPGIAGFSSELRSEDGFSVADATERQKGL